MRLPNPIYPSSASRFRTVGLILLFLLQLTAVGYAGGGSAGFVVVYNPQDIRSVTIANHYQVVRGIPERNMIPYVFPQWFERRTAWDFVLTLRSEIAARGLESQLQGIAIAGEVPLSAAQHNSGSYEFSIQSFLYLSPNYGHASFPTGAYVQQNAYSYPHEFFGAAPAGTKALTAQTVFNGARYWPVSFVGSTGVSGNSPKEILELINRSKAADGSKVSGTIYWPLNSDVRSTTRQRQIAEVAPVWRDRGIKFEVIGDSLATTEEFWWVRDKNDISGGIVGSSIFRNRNNRFLPGAWVDHLTSVGGWLNTLTTFQTPASTWLRAGAYGSSGTMNEPYAIAAKFPHAHIHTHLRAGASLVEAFWQSIRQPAEIVCLGDPLMQPHADFPSVTVSSPASGAVVSGIVQIHASANATGGRTIEDKLDLFVDGRRICFEDSSESITASRNAGGFSLDTNSLPDGWHELRVAAYNNDSVRTQGEATLSIHVNNEGRSLELVGPTTVNPDQNATFSVTPAGLSDLVSLSLRSNGRLIASAPLGGGSVTVPGSSFARVAPLDGMWFIQAVGTRSNGQQVLSPPLKVPISWSPHQGVQDPPRGAGLALVKFYADTVSPQFDWDTSVPTASVEFFGDVYGILDTSPTNVPGVSISDFSLRPGYELNFWFFAPVDDWYEIWNAGVAFRRQLFINDQEYSEPQGVYAPVRLAPGWHRIKLRFAFHGQSTSSIRIRGGWSQDFEPVYPSMAASPVQNEQLSRPSIQNIHYSQPVTGVSVPVSAQATIGNGTPGELAQLKYEWTLVSAPAWEGTKYFPGEPDISFVSYSLNNSEAAKNTTITFTNSGLHVFLLRVTGPESSTSRLFSVDVAPVASNLVLPWYSQQKILRGLPLSLSAYSVDQFGRRILVEGATPSAPTVEWSTSDPNATVTPQSADGERVEYRSLSNAGTSESFRITAKGINGRTGLATTPPFTVQTNAAPSTSSLISAIQVTQPVPGGPIRLSAQVSDPETDANNPNGAPVWTDSLLEFQWSVGALPPGETLELEGSHFQQAVATPSGPGLYTVQLVATDQAGASLTTNGSFMMNAEGRLLGSPAPTISMNTRLFVGETVDLTANLPWDFLPATFQWQSSQDGQIWVNLEGQDQATLTLGPLTPADSGRFYRVIAAHSGRNHPSEGVSLPTINDPSGGVVGFVASQQTLTYPENTGTFEIIVRRSGRTDTACSINYQLPSWFVGFGLNPAQPGADFYLSANPTIFNGTLNWAAGDGSDRVLTIQIVDDSLGESDESFWVMLSQPQGTLLSSNSFIRFINIADNDGPGKASFVGPSTIVSEGDGLVRIPVRREGRTAGELSVNYEVVGYTAVEGQDFHFVSGHVCRN